MPRHLLRELDGALLDRAVREHGYEHRDLRSDPDELDRADRCLSRGCVPEDDRHVVGEPREQPARALEQLLDLAVDLGVESPDLPVLDRAENPGRVRWSTKYR